MRKVNLFSTKVTSNEEIDYDNKRLVYVNDLVPVTTHSYEDHNLSTDQVISLFDGGYRVGILEQLDYVKNQSKFIEEQVLVLINEFERFTYEQNIDSQSSKKFILEFKTILREYQLNIESNLRNKFDVCQYSNEKRVRNQEVKNKGEEFLEGLLRTFRNLRKSGDLF
ncbi:hypothetical protein [Polynucleobacter sp. Adler-ghost]|uniref:hypothetical protein n=1 Tax=Polynucleobacter sp. Adler-ghost TaxID=2770234 RepID=UPI001BFDC196|nr:hypothetical protein [Polynucleobacter sp. Adler-ghost]QWE30527.1 hypothetical protein ICV89_09630 [Polynucleobacter sp. Adler-ghost]